MEFETLFKMVVGVAAAFAIPIGAYAAVAAIRVHWPASTRGPGPDLEALDARLRELEQVEQRVLELEERLDFAERMLASGPRPDPGADTPPEAADAVR